MSIYLSKSRAVGNRGARTAIAPSYFGRHISIRRVMPTKLQLASPPLPPRIVRPFYGPVEKRPDVRGLSDPMIEV